MLSFVSWGVIFMMDPHESLDGKMIELRVGERGCGKSDIIRARMGLTPEQYECSVKHIEEVLKSEREQRDMIEKMEYF
jgi:ABC-type glutathione transport system ATPase component